MDAGATKRVPPGPADPVERLLREWPELGAFGVNRVRAWASPVRERLVEIARVAEISLWLRRGAEACAQPRPYMVEARRGTRRPIFRRDG